MVKTVETTGEGHKGRGKCGVVRRTSGPEGEKEQGGREENRRDGDSSWSWALHVKAWPLD